MSDISIEPDNNFATADDVIARLAEAGLDAPARSTVLRNLATAVTEWQDRTGFKPFVASADATPRAFPVGGRFSNGEGLLDLHAGAVEIVSVGSGALVLTPPEYIALPANAPYDSEPWTMLRLARLGYAGWFPGAREIVVTARWGYCDAASVPPDAAEAVLCRAAWLSARGVLVLDGADDDGPGSGRLESTTEAENKKQWDTAGLDKRQRAFVNDLEAYWKAAIMSYRLFGAS